MRTKQQIINAIALKKKSDFFGSSTWQDLTSTISNLDQAQKDELLAYILTKDDNQLGFTLRSHLEVDALERATDRATTLLADDSLDLTELDQLI